MFWSEEVPTRDFSLGANMAWYGINPLTFAMALMLFVNQYHHSNSGLLEAATPPIQTKPAPAPGSNPPACQVDSSQVANLVNQQMRFIDPSVLQSWPKPTLINPGPAFDRYVTWVSAIAGAVNSDKSPDPSPTGNDAYASLSADAYRELVAIGAAHYSCNGVSGCKDLEAVAADLAGTVLWSAGFKIFNAFHGQCSESRAAAATYLRAHYGVPAAN
ncbi:MAG: hypothetical protein ABSC64_18570 [Candidatus Korobacteraceae bacterium]|jgi:hypothetical protein